MKIPFTFIKIETLKKLKAEYDALFKSNNSATAFIKEIENGNLEAVSHINKDTADDLTLALFSMQQQLKKIAEEEKERNWSTQGLAKFAEILRSDNTEPKVFYQNIISNIVKYLNANQGGLFLINEDDDIKNSEIELVACYAYNRQKYLNKTIKPGEGLIGQCYLEKETILLTDIPQNYINITSGLGAASPGCVVIIPLKVNEEIHGILELASFEKFKPFQVTFLERLGEIIASTVSNVKINSKTKALLLESRQKEEEMRAQEEEMRQNVEELSATQEEVYRVLQEAKQKERYISELMGASKDNIMSINQDYNIIDFNNSFLDQYKKSGIYINKGDSVFKLIPEENKQKYKELFSRVFRGEGFEINEHNQVLNLYFLATFSPLRDIDGAIYGAAIFSKDITEMLLAKEEAEKLLKESQQQTEEMRAQEEELRQNMEELHSIHENLSSVQQELKLNEDELRKQLLSLEEAKAEIDRVRIIEQERANERVESQKKAAEKMMLKFKDNEQVLKNQVAELMKELESLKN